MGKKELELKKLQMLLSTSEILNSKQDTNVILDVLLTKSLELIEGGDTGAIFLHNPKENCLAMRAYKGMGDSVKDIKLKPGESMTGIAFEKKKAIFFKNSESIQNAMKTMRKENVDLALKGNVIASDVHGSICCPLIYRDKAIGVLVIDNSSTDTSLKEEDVDFLKIISVQATIAIMNAQNYEMELENNRKLEKYNEIIKNERNKYQYATSIHTKFTEMILNGSTIEDILAEIKSLIHKDVFIIDLFYNVKYSLIDDLEMIKTIDKELVNLIKHINKHGKTEYFNMDKGIYYEIFPIMVNRERLGWLCIFSENNSGFNELDRITAERGSTSLALEFLKQNELLDMEQSIKGDFLDALILNNDSQYIQKCSQRYGFDLEADHVIISVEFDMFLGDIVDENMRDKESKRALKKYYQIINEYLKKCFPNAISLIKGHLIVVVIEFSSGQQKGDIDEFISYFDEKCTHMNRNDFKKCKYKIGISDICRSIDDFKESYYKSMYALKMIDSCKEGMKYVYYRDLEVKKFLLNNDFEELRAFVDNILGPLNEYGNSSKEEFIRTLRTYLRTNCNWSETKNILRIHGNTLTYRLNRISEILDMDIGDYSDRFRLQIAFEILDLNV